MTTWLIIIRAVHFGACLLLFGIYAFDRFIAPGIAGSESKIGDYWRMRLRQFGLVLWPIILVSGAAWFALVAMSMSGQPLQFDILKIVWTQTQFGTVWEVRGIFLLLAGTAIALAWFLKSQSAFQKCATWFLLAVNGCLLGSLAWAGHGQESSPWHLFADVLHLLVAGVWPAGLVPLLLLLRRAGRVAEVDDWFSIAKLVRRFSAISLAAVALLVITGWVNGWFLVGTVSNLIGQPYGRWLLAKIILLCIALAIASVNLLRLKPRLLVESSQPERAKATTAQLQANVRFELILGIAIVVIVAVLGILPPAIH
jgi:copper resistance protein D